ncbi:MAG: metal ABC transporter substrate-binding protein [Nitrososphaerota archaeon]
MKKYVLIAVLILIVALFFIFIPPNIRPSLSQQNLEGKKVVVVTTGILADVVYNIAGDRVIIKQLMTGGDIHDWEPSAKDIAEASKASIVIYLSRNVEKWIDKFETAIPDNVELIEAAENVEFLTMDGIVDPHIWFDIRNMIKVTERVCGALIKNDPDNAKYYSENAERFKGKLNELHERYLSELSKLKGRIIITRHDAYRYLGNTYGLVTIAILGVYEEEISPTKMQYLIELIKKEDIKVIFSEYEKTEDFINNFAAEHGLKIIKLYSLENISLEDVVKNEGYIFRMSKNLDALVGGLSLE